MSKHLRRLCPEVFVRCDFRRWPEASVICVAAIRPESGGEADMTTSLNRRATSSLDVAPPRRCPCRTAMLPLRVAEAFSRPWNMAVRTSTAPAWHRGRSFEFPTKMMTLRRRRRHPAISLDQRAKPHRPARAACHIRRCNGRRMGRRREAGREFDERKQQNVDHQGGSASPAVGCAPE